MRKYLVCKKEEIKCKNIIKNIKMVNIDDIIIEKIKKKYPNRTKILDHPCIVLIIRIYGSGKTNSLLNVIID